MTSFRLSRDLTLEVRRVVPDLLGGQVERWVAVGRCWAEVVAGAGRDVPGEEMTLSSVPYRITVRGAPAESEMRPRPDQRFREGSRVFRIIAVTERDRHGRFLLCFAREEVAT